MSRLKLHSILFCLGFLLAFIFMHGLHVIAKRDRADPPSARARISAETEPAPLQASEPDTYAAVDDKNIVAPEVPSLSGRIQHIIDGIHENNPNAIRFLHPDVLNDFPEYERREYEPKLKYEILKKLVHELSRSEWLQWSTSETDGQTIKTSARRFINTIRDVNFTLGRYVETAALLYSGLYFTTRSGRLFSAEEELYNLMLEADQLFRTRTPAALSSRVYLDSEITEDSNFQIWLERLRARFVVEFCNRESRQIELQLYLLSSVKEGYHSDAVLRVYKEILGAATDKITARFRDELRSVYFSPGEAKKLMTLMPSLALPIERFYQRSFEDKIVVGDRSGARSVYLKFSGMFPESDLLEKFRHDIAELGSDETIDQQGDVLTAVEGKDSLAVSDTEKERRGTFSFGSESGAPGSSFANSIERIGIFIIILLGVGLFFRKRWSLVVDRVNTSRKKARKGRKTPPDNVEPIDRAPRLRSIASDKPRSYKGSGKKVANN
jgi:hypothetical protein